MVRKIAVITGSRAEYGLLYWLMKEIQQDPALSLQVVATCMHLSPEFGYTYHLIEQDGFEINEKIEMLLSSDSAVGVTKSMAVGMMGFADAFRRLQPDIIVLLGDRFEALAVAQAAMMQQIPIAHIHGGELSEGAIDDAIRHAITKLSHVHFVAAESYRQRVTQMGENPMTVFNFGAPGLERIKRTSLLSKEALEEAIQFKFSYQTLLVTYHPATLNLKENEKALSAIFSALDHFLNINVLFTKSNADESGRFLNKKIDEYVSKNSHRMKAYVSMGDVNYLSALQFVDVVMGNSSSGLIEVPVFKKPTVNIGARQANRLRSDSIIDCDVNVDSIRYAIEKALLMDCSQVVPAYTQDATSVKIKEKIKSVDLDLLLRKRFYDIHHC